MASNPKAPRTMVESDGTYQHRETPSCRWSGCVPLADFRAASPLPAEPPPTNPFRLRWEAHKRLIESTDAGDRLRVWLAEFLWRNMTPLPAKIDRWINASDGTVVAFYEEMMPIIDREIASLRLAATPSAAEPPDLGKLAQQCAAAVCKGLPGLDQRRVARVIQDVLDAASEPQKEE